MTRHQVEALLHEASMNFIKTGDNRDEVVYYINMIEELNHKETTEALEGHGY